MDVKLLHKHWLTNTKLRYKKYHSELTEFDKALKEHRFRSSNWIKTQTEIDSPFTFQTVINDKFNLARRNNSTRMVCDRLKTTVKNYAMENYYKGFEIF